MMLYLQRFVQVRDIGMTAAGLYQSVVGLVLVLISNIIIARRIDKNAALF